MPRASCPGLYATMSFANPFDLVVPRLFLLIGGHWKSGCTIDKGSVDVQEGSGHLIFIFEL